MTDLSPAAQAVLDAFNSGFNRPVAVHLKPRLAAALKAAADQAAPEKQVVNIDYVHQMYTDGMKDALAVIEEIADELDGANSTSENGLLQ
jgi:hypothetical protein